MIKLFDRSYIMTCDETLKGVRVKSAEYKDGLIHHLEKQTFDVICNVQPLNDKDLLLVPEGDRHKEQYYIFSEQMALPLQINDTIIRNGINYQVQGVQDWGSYSRSRIMRDDVGPKSEGNS